MIILIIAIVLSAVSGCATTQCPKVYEVHYLPQPEINIDGKLDEPAWKKSYPEKGFSFPWEKGTAPLTEFRSLCDNEFFYFSFRLRDETIVVENKFSSESVMDTEDRVEIFFACEDKLKKYFCLEIDPRGRVHDYAASYYRKFDSSWNCAGILTATSIINQGYVIEGSIPLKTLETLGLPRLDSSHMLKVGLFRAELNQGQDSKPQAQWISWIEPGTKQPDFHVPSAFGCFQRTK